MQDRGREGRQVAIVDLGNTNLTRYKYALAALGHRPEVATSGASIAEAPVAIVPGSGNLHQTIQHLQRSGLAEGLRARVEAGLPTLAINIGTQVFCEGYVDIDGSGAGLGFLPGIVRRLPDQGVKGDPLINPHIGWNAVKVLSPVGPVTKDDIFYFAHQRVIDVGTRWDECVKAQTQHTLIFPAVISQGSLVGLQFQPELSGTAGLRLLSDFCRQAAPLSA